MKRQFWSLVSGVCLIFMLIGCQSEQESDEQTKQTTVNQNQQANSPFNQVKKATPKPLSETKKGEFISSKMLTLSEFNPATSEDIYVHLTGQVVNVGEKENWAVIRHKDVYFYAFGHANMSIMKKTYLGQDVYIMALLDEVPLTENLVIDAQKNGMAPGQVSDDLVKGYRLNTTKIALVKVTDKDVFMGLKK